MEPRPSSPRLYASLVRQGVTSSCFEWLIIDDGSTDRTAEYLASLAPDAPFPLRVIRLENGGKHRAINAGAQHIQGRWAMIVDSDDYLVEGSLDHFIEFLMIWDSDQSVGMIMSKMRFLNGNHAQTVFPRNVGKIRYYKRAALTEVIDCTFSFRKEAILLFPYPEVIGEKFMAHGWLPNAMSERFFSVFYDDVVVCAEYQKDGVSSNPVTIRSKNPVSAMHVYRIMSLYPQTFKRRLKNNLSFWRYFFHAKWKGKVVSDEDIPKPWPSIYVAPLSWMLASFDKFRRRPRAVFDQSRSYPHELK
ncbi:glycosyltransferase family 2 protein [Novosphingobium panipatense]